MIRRHSGQRSQPDPAGGAPTPEDHPGQVRQAADRTITAAAFAFYLIVFAAVAAMSYRGLVGFAEDTLALTGTWRYIVPISLDGAAVSASLFGYRASIHGEPAFGPRTLVCLFGGASAFFNWHEAITARGTLAAAFYASMSILVVVMFDLGAKQIRRRALARQGKLEPPLPRFRLARWLLAPAETFRALRIAALASDLTADEAVQRARNRRAVRVDWDDVNDDRSRPPAPAGLTSKTTGTAVSTQATLPVPDLPTAGTTESADDLTLDMVRTAVSAGRRLTGADVSGRLGCHAGEGRKLLRAARLRHLRELLDHPNGETTLLDIEHVARLYQVRADHAAQLLKDAAAETPTGGASS